MSGEVKEIYEDEIYSPQIIKYGCPVCNNYNAKFEYIIIIHMAKEHTMKEIEDICK